MLGNYVILDKLGQGGMGLVLKAVHRRMERLVALKVYRGGSWSSPALRTADPRCRAGLRRRTRPTT